MPGPRSLRCILPFVALVAALPAQELPATTPDQHGVTLQVNARAGLQRLDGQLWGFANDYKVRFDDDGLEFTPVLGRAAPRNYPMTLRLDSIRRDGTAADLRAGKPDARGLRVEYDRGAAIERYDLQLDAVEQSLVFEKRPAGSGDLIVRARLQTDMVVTAEHGGLRLEQPGVGGFRIGAVTGVDANGERAAGEVRYVDNWLELSLPAAFVDRAALPFVLDPLIGSAFGVSVGAPGDGLPRAAYDVTTDLYLVVWSTSVSSTDRDIYCQRVSRAGALVGTRIAIDATTFSATEPDVANIDIGDAFAVAYTFQGHILVSVVGANGSGGGQGWLLVGGPANKHSPTIGGDPASTGGVLVWDSDSDNALLAARVSVTGFEPRLGSVQTVFSGSTGRGRRPRISKSGPRFAIAFERVFTPVDPWVIVVDGSGVPVTPAVSLDARLATGTFVEVDGDGSNWVAAWQDQAGTAGSNILARGLSFAPNPGRIELGPLGFSTTDPITEQTPVVIWTASSALVGWSRESSFPIGGSVNVRSLEPFRCMACEPAPPTSLGGGQLNRTPSGCSTLSGGGNGDDALLVWTARSVTPLDEDVYAHLWHSADGAVTQVFPACGSGGTALAPCVRVPSPDFTHRLRASSPNAPTFLVQSLARGDFACGSCLFVPAVGSAVVLFGVTDSAGNCAFASPIPDDPALRGLVQFEQWLTMRTTGPLPCPLYPLDLSSALRLVIE